MTDKGEARVVKEWKAESGLSYRVLDTGAIEWTAPHYQGRWVGGVDSAGLGPRYAACIVALESLLAAEMELSEDERDPNWEERTALIRCALDGPTP